MHDENFSFSSLRIKIYVNQIVGIEARSNLAAWTHMRKAQWANGSALEAWTHAWARTQDNKPKAQWANESALEAWTYAQAHPWARARDNKPNGLMSQFGSLDLCPSSCIRQSARQCAQSPMGYWVGFGSLDPCPSSCMSQSARQTHCRVYGHLAKSRLTICLMVSVGDPLSHDQTVACRCAWFDTKATQK